MTHISDPVLVKTMKLLDVAASMLGDAALGRYKLQPEQVFELVSQMREQAAVFAAMADVPYAAYLKPNSNPT